ncbi:hypothetical protein RHCRD62_10518 [Rhodococcus sp. RD6.2]|nr:hypothetical protein RHCRD62_10518 [Rhodococcus sp. RD6.2]
MAVAPVPNMVRVAAARRIAPLLKRLLMATRLTIHLVVVSGCYIIVINWFPGTGRRIGSSTLSLGSHRDRATAGWACSQGGGSA